MNHAPPPQPRRRLAQQGHAVWQSQPARATAGWAQATGTSRTGTLWRRRRPGTARTSCRPTSAATGSTPTTTRWPPGARSGRAPAPPAPATTALSTWAPRAAGRRCTPTCCAPTRGAPTSRASSAGCCCRRSTPGRCTTRTWRRWRQSSGCPWGPAAQSGRQVTAARRPQAPRRPLPAVLRSWAEGGRGAAQAARACAWRSSRWRMTRRWRRASRTCAWRTRTCTRWCRARVTRCSCLPAGTTPCPTWLTRCRSTTTGSTRTARTGPGRCWPRSTRARRRRSLTAGSCAAARRSLRAWCRT
mmetsp:Transcript_34746/g.87949  ORF Transcript_34746/g.87949 Transcript_34746/m.87949 type:complete len:301 (+) Transcript_34746:745-1647(+)